MSFLRHEEIFPSDEGAVPVDRAPTHRLDEFPAGYSLAGCAPAEPTSVSPDTVILMHKDDCVKIVFRDIVNCCVLSF